MRPRHPSIVPLLFFLPALGCSDPADPCDRPNACEAEGVDLAVVEVALVTTGLHPATGLGLVPSDTVEITYSVRNRGSVRSEPARLVVDYGYIAGGSGLVMPDTQAVPALRPGELHRHHVRLETGESHHGARAAGRFGDTARASLRVMLADADTSNNFSLSEKVHRRIALIRLGLEVPDTVVSLTVPFTVHISTTNESAVAAMPAGALGFWLCEWATAWHCSRVLETFGFGIRPWPALAPGETHTEEWAVSVPLHGADNVRPAHYRLVATLARSEIDETTIYGMPWLFNEDVVLSVHPNFAACNPARLRPDTTVAAPLVCSVPSRNYVFEFNPRSDREYSFEQGTAPGATVKRADGSVVMDVLPGNWYRFTDPGPLYAVDFLPVGEPTTPTRPMTLRERPLTSPVAAATGALR